MEIRNINLNKTVKVRPLQKAAFTGHHIVDKTSLRELLEIMPEKGNAFLLRRHDDPRLATYLVLCKAELEEAKGLFHSVITEMHEHLNRLAKFAGNHHKTEEPKHHTLKPYKDKIYPDANFSLNLVAKLKEKYPEIHERVQKLFM